MRAPDLRAGVALVLAGLVAEGETLVTGARHIDLVAAVSQPLADEVAAALPRPPRVLPCGVALEPVA